MPAKILRFNDEACMSLMYGSLQGALSIGASEETADTILPFLLNRIGCFYPRMTLEIKVHPHAAIMEMLAEGLVDLALTTHQPPGFTSFTLRTSPTLWYCAAEYVLARGESIPLILLEEPSPFRQDIIAALETARVSWHLAHGASSLSGVKAAVKAGLGVTARPVEMMSPDLRVAGISEGLPALPDTRYVVSCNPRTVSELPQAIFQSLSQEIHPWETGTALTPEEGGNTLVL